MIVFKIIAVGMLALMLLRHIALAFLTVDEYRKHLIEESIKMNHRQVTTFAHRFVESIAAAALVFALICVLRTLWPH